MIRSCMVVAGRIVGRQGIAVRPNVAPASLVRYAPGNATCAPSGEENTRFASLSHRQTSISDQTARLNRNCRMECHKNGRRTLLPASMPSRPLSSSPDIPPDAARLMPCRAQRSQTREPARRCMS